MMNAFEESLLDQIANGEECQDVSWNDEEKGEFKKKQAKITILIQRLLSMKLARQVMMTSTGTEMWDELVSVYGGQEKSCYDCAEGVSLAGRATQDLSAWKRKRTKPSLQTFRYQESTCRLKITRK